MSKYSTRGRIRGALELIAASGLLLCGWGCAGNSPAALTIHSIAHNQSFSEPFAAAYSTRSVGGGTSIVLVDKPAQQSMAGAAGTAPVRQVMSIRVMWNPMRDVKSDHHSASNATIHWYVMGNTPATRAQIIEYSGTALVLVDQTPNGAELTIRNASIRPVACRGALNDPIGAAELYGTFHATNDPPRVREILSTVRTVVAAANTLPGNSSAEAPSTLVQ